MNADGEYGRNNDAGVLIDDVRFKTNVVPTTAIATSTGQSDPGLFEVSFRGPRHASYRLQAFVIEISTLLDQPLGSAIQRIESSL